MKKLNIIGLGVKEIDQLTLEAIHIIQKSDLVLVLPVVQKNAVEKISSLTGKDVIDLKYLYKDKTEDLENYKNIFNEVIQSFKKNESKNIQTISLLIPGHPRIGVLLTSLFEAAKSSYHYELNVIPGISSFDTMINDLKIDPLEHGTALLDANRILTYKTFLNPEINTFIYHICSIGTSKIHLTDTLIYNRIDLLQEVLLKHYDENAIAIITSSPVTPDGKTEQLQFPIKEFKNNASSIHFGTTLFIPSQRKPYV